MTISLGKRMTAVVATALLLIAASGCSSTTQTGMDGSRHELFESLQALSGASSAVAVVEVIDQTTTTDDIPTTISTVKVIESFTPEGLAEALAVDPSKVADSIQVRQMGAAGMGLPYSILQIGDKYLLFLTPSGLEGKEAVQFYITGGSAGMYTIDGDTYVHGPFEEGDVLPEKLTASDLR